ncbi:hypothetical protein AHAS_Ahas11G0108500 [Arachis hypogaea]
MLRLYKVNLKGNSFKGSIPNLSNCTHLQYLLLTNNWLTGLHGLLPSSNKTQTPKTILDLVITKKPLCFKLFRHFIIYFCWRNHGEEIIPVKLGISSPVMTRTKSEP